MRSPSARRPALAAAALALAGAGDAPVAPPPGPVEPGVHSPDNRLAFLAAPAPHAPARIVTARPDGSNRFMVVAADSSPGARGPGVSGLGATGLAWSPDGTRLAFAMHRYGPTATPGSYAVEVVGADGSGRTAVATGQAKGVTLGGWAPDGRSVVYHTLSGSFSTERALFTASLDGGGARRLMPALPTWAAPTTPRWAPDGTRIAFQSAHDSTNRVYTVAPDGSGLSRLVDRGTRAYAWSPDGARVAYTSSPGDGRVELLGVAAMPGSVPVLLTDQPVGRVEPVWSPDGTRIAFASGPPGEADLYVIGADGTGLRRLTTAAGDDVGPAWSPDGARIAFASARGGRWDVFSVGADGAGETNLTRTPDADETAVTWR